MSVRIPCEGRPMPVLMDYYPTGGSGWLVLDDGSPAAARPGPQPARRRPIAWSEAAGVDLFDIPWTLIHESAHAVVGDALGLPAGALYVPGDGSGEGYYAIAYPPVPACFCSVAVATAAGVVSDRMRGPGLECVHQSDLRHIRDLQSQFEAATGNPMDFDPFELAAEMLADRAITDAIERLAASLRPDKVYSAAEVKVLIRHAWGHAE